MPYPNGVNTVNIVKAQNAYPSFPGSGSLGQEATMPYPQAVTGGPVSTGNSGGGTAAQVAAAVGETGQPVTWWVALAAILVALMYFSTKYDDGQYANLRASAYNIFTVTLAAIVGISLFKLLFTKFPVPGLSTIVLSV